MDTSTASSGAEMYINGLSGSSHSEHTDSTLGLSSAHEIGPCSSPSRQFGIPSRGDSPHPEQGRVPFSTTNTFL